MNQGKSLFAKDIYTLDELLSRSDDESIWSEDFISRKED